MAVTAFPVLARILVETGLNKSPLGALTLTCAAFNDVVAWCLLAFVIAVVRSGGLLDAWTTTAATLGFIGIMYGGLRPFLARIAERYGTSRHISQSALALILVLVLCCALFSEAIGIHALFGAFLCGVVMPRQGHLIHNLREKLDDLVGVLLLPLFFASTGLKTQIGLLDTPALWAIGAIVLAVATAGKLLGSALPARWGGLSWRESFALGVMMNTRGLMELIILNIGLELGVLSPVLFAILVLVAVFSTLITTPILTLLFPTHTFVAQQTGPHPPTLPALSLLTCLSHPEAVAGLARLSSQLCRSSDARAYALRLVPVQEDSSLFPSEPLTEEEDVASAAVRLSQSHGVDMQPISFPSANPARDICTVSRLKKADLILMGAHRSLLGRGPLAGLVQEVAINADCDVAIFLEMGFEGARRVLVAQAGPDTAAIKRILSWLSQSPGIQIIPFDLASGNADSLIEAAQGYDLVIIGFRGHWMQALSGFDLSKGRRVREMPCSLLVVHGN
jgi:nucleotide-binding universal stress UspA family protein